MRLTFIGPNHSYLLTIVSNSTEVSTVDLKTNFLEPFIVQESNVDSKENEVKIEGLKKYDSGFKNFIDNYIEKYAQYDRKIYDIRKMFFRHLSLGAFFILIPQRELSQYEVHGYRTIIESYNLGLPLAELQDKFIHGLGKILEQYEIEQFGVFRERFGLSKPKKCRFCQKNEEIETSFNKTAHSISESLGNKNLITLDECDTCNTFFGQKIEPSLTKFLQFQLVAFGIVGSDGIPKIKGTRTEVSNESGVINFELKDKGAIQVNESETFASLGKISKINPHNCYKSLVKFFLSVLKQEKLPNFSSTINWIRGKEKYVFLPDVMIRIFKDKVYRHPIITSFVLKEDVKGGVSFAELRVANISLLYIIPTPDLDLDLCNEFCTKGPKLDEICFNEYSRIDLSLDKEINYEINFKVKH